MTTKVLNLYAGIGGNRKLWDEVEDINVTAVEWDEEKAQVYSDHFPNDDVIVTDAHEYLINNMSDYDFIWSSPPCPTHSCMEPLNHSQHGPRYPDMNLYQEIIILQQHHEPMDFDYVVENVQSYYDPLVEPQQRARHYFWCNYQIPPFDLPPQGISGGFPDRDSEFDFEEHEQKMGYDMSGYDISKSKKGKMLRNCVHPDLGKHIFASCGKQTTLF